MKLAEILERPLSAIITAKRFSGKTFLIKEILNDREIKNRYDEIYVFTDTSLLDDTWKQINNKKVYLDDDYKESKLVNLLNSLKEDFLESGKKVKVLIVVDDLIEVYNNKKKGVFTTLATRSRHYGVDYIFSTQKYNRLPPIIRLNSTTKLFFKITNKQEMNVIKEELSTRDLPEEEVEKMIDETTKEAYTYILFKEGEETMYYKGKGVECKKLN